MRQRCVAPISGAIAQIPLLADLLSDRAQDLAIDENGLFRCDVSPL